MAVDNDELVTVSLTLTRREFNKLTKITCKLTYEEALRDAALEQICNYCSKTDKDGNFQYRVVSPID